MLKKIFTIVLVVSTAFIINSCTSNDDEKPDIPDISVINIQQETSWDYMVAGKKDYYFIKANSNNKPHAVLFHSSQANKDIGITFTAEGLPEYVICNDYIFSFKNYNGRYVDVGVVYPNGEIEVLRDIDTGIDWNSLALSKNSIAEAWSDVVRWTGRIVSGVPCALSAASTIASHGGTWPLTAWSCGNYLLSLSTDIAQDEFDIHNGFTEFVDAYNIANTVYTCNQTNKWDCFFDLSARAIDGYADYLQELEAQEASITQVNSIMLGGYGDIQITLGWNNTSDLDLWVTDPNNETIYWAESSSSSGGWLDYDDTDGYGPENIFWDSGNSIPGVYKVEVDYYSGTGTAEYWVYVKVNNQAKTYTGYISPDETKLVLTFNRNQSLPKMAENNLTHSTINRNK
jgi:hypothetical protein